MVIFVSLKIIYYSKTKQYEEAFKQAFALSRIKARKNELETKGRVFPMSVSFFFECILMGENWTIKIGL
jgi:hypothetical protein